MQARYVGLGVGAGGGDGRHSGVFVGVDLPAKGRHVSSSAREMPVSVLQNNLPAKKPSSECTY